MLTDLGIIFTKGQYCTEALLGDLLFTLLKGRPYLTNHSHLIYSFLLLVVVVVVVVVVVLVIELLLEWPEVCLVFCFYSFVYRRDKPK